MRERLNIFFLVSAFFRWLQPDSYADPQKTSLILNKDDIRCGWPTTVVVQTKDQYGDVVHVPNMKVGQSYAKRYSFLSYLIFFRKHCVSLVGRWRWRLSLSPKRNLFIRTTWKSCSGSWEAPLTQPQAWISPLVAFQHQSLKPLMNPWSLRRLATLLSPWWRFTAAVLFICSLIIHN